MIKADITRDSFVRSAHRRTVRHQQGRVPMDADINEAQDLIVDRVEIETRDVIGLGGGPKTGAGFAISVNGSGQLQLSAGRYYVDGLLCQLDEPTLLTAQLDLPGFNLPVPSGVYLAYLDASFDHVGTLDDPSLQEVALHGADTTTRQRVKAQVRLVRVNTNPSATVTCSTDFAVWNAIIAAPTGAVAVRAEPEAAPENECSMTPGAGYRSLLNQLYCLVIHDPGNETEATYKWSRENGSIASLWLSQDGNDLTVESQGRDPHRLFRANGWVELIDRERELREEPGTLVRLTNVRDNILTIDPATAPGPVDFSAFGTSPRVRRWESVGALPLNQAPDADGYSPLEFGVQARFAPGTYRTGDYWMVPARTATGDVEWPRDDVTHEPVFQPRQGVHHHFAKLALVSFNGAAWSLRQDCRQFFPPLTDITAEDVSFNNTVCDFDAADTVQEALDSLCQRLRSRCTLVARPGDDLQALFDSIGAGQDAHVCFCVGSFQLSTTINVAGKGHLHISGAGAGSRLVAATHEAALIFQNCREVIVEDLYAESGATGRSGARNHLNGTLTFLNCEAVTVEGASLRCGAGAERLAACLTVRDERSETIQGLNRCTVRVLHCNFEVGHQQTGILLANVGRSVVEDNFLRVAPRPQGVTLSSLAENLRLRARLRRLLISSAKVGPVRGTDPAGTINVSLGGQQLSFRTDPALAGAWQALVTSNPLPAGASRAASIRHLNRLADNVILNAGAIANIGGFRDWFRAVTTDQDPTVASQGIVVGGRNAPDVRIKNNTIEGVLQGVHVGVSHREASRGTADQAGTVSIIDNRLRILLSPLARRDRHAIFVGNCDTLYVENNQATVQRFGNTTAVPIDGISVHGVLGLMMIVRQNHLQNFSVGVRVTPVFRPPTNRTIFQWLVAQNMMPNSAQTVIAPTQVRRVENFA
ncbi:MAG TPA: DUF6519 domain-containing protein [Terrimicrobiaceae bacterium]|nr:DUF6519 domain-containing protein [Terrimicrobiaceae bacterium]